MHAQSLFQKAILPAVVAAALSPAVFAGALDAASTTENIAISSADTNQQAVVNVDAWSGTPKITLSTDNDTTNATDVTTSITLDSDGTAAGSSTTIAAGSNSIVVSGTENTITGTTSLNGASTINNTLTVDSNGATGNVANTTGLLNVTNGGSVNLGVASGGNFAATGTQAQVSAGSASYTAYETAQVVGTDYTLLNGNAASRALVTGASVTNIISGNTLIDGNVYINGSLTYSSNTSASTTVTGTNTAGSMNIVNSGQTGAVVDANGKITTGGTTSQATASLTVTNTLGNTHGIVVQESKTTISGGNNSTSLTLDDNGARFSNSATGAPTRVTGVADGTSDFDAVNYRQLKNVAAGVAGVAAMANIPQLDQGKTIAVGVGVGSFQSENALALGATFRVNNNAVIRASVATQGSRSNKTTVYGLGAGLSW